MSFGKKLQVKSDTMQVFATAGTIGMHMVSGPMVGFAIGYGLDKWLDTTPWFKLVFFIIGIGAGFLNVYEDSKKILRSMQSEKDRKHKKTEEAEQQNQVHNNQDA